MPLISLIWLCAGCGCMPGMPCAPNPYKILVFIPGIKPGIDERPKLGTLGVNPEIPREASVALVPEGSMELLKPGGRPIWESTAAFIMGSEERSAVGFKLLVNAPP